MTGNKCGKTQRVFKCSFFSKMCECVFFPSISLKSIISSIVPGNVVDIYAGGKCIRHIKKNKGIFQNNSNESMLCMKRILKYICVLRLCIIFFRAYVVGLKCFVGTAVFQVAIHFRFIWFDFGKVAL